jgi:hypothetical protein
MITAHAVATDVVRKCGGWSGSEGLTRPGILERVFRDMHVASAHAVADRNGMTTAAVPLMAAHRDERERATRGE